MTSFFNTSAFAGVSGTSLFCAAALYSLVCIAIGAMLVAGLRSMGKSVAHGEPAFTCEPVDDGDSIQANGGEEDEGTTDSRGPTMLLFEKLKLTLEKRKGGPTTVASPTVDTSAPIAAGAIDCDKQPEEPARSMVNSTDDNAIIEAGARNDEAEKQVKDTVIPVQRETKFNPEQALLEMQRFQDQVHKTKRITVNGRNYLTNTGLYAFGHVLSANPRPQTEPPILDYEWMIEEKGWVEQIEKEHDEIYKVDIEFKTKRIDLMIEQRLLFDYASWESDNSFGLQHDPKYLSTSDADRKRRKEFYQGLEAALAVDRASVHLELFDLEGKAKGMKKTEHNPDLAEALESIQQYFQEKGMVLTEAKEREFLVDILKEHEEREIKGGIFV